MKLIVILIFSLLLIQVNPTYSQRDSGTIKLQKYTLTIDTLRVQTIIPKDNKKWYESSFMPWVASLLIAIVSVLVNIKISRSARKTSLKVAESQFQATLNTNNRQDWINKVRDCVSELMTQCKNLNIEFQEETRNDNNRKILHEKVSYQKFKLQLLLSAGIPKHQELLASVHEIMKILDFHVHMTPERFREYNQNPEFFALSEKIIEQGRDLLYTEWQKIQKHQFKG